MERSTKHLSIDVRFVAVTTRRYMRVHETTKHVSIDTCFVETRAFRG